MLFCKASERHIFASVLISIFLLPSLAEAKDLPSGDITISGYPVLSSDRPDTDVTIATNIRFSDKISYFSYVNFGGVLHSNDADFVRSEQNLRLTLSKSIPIDLNVQGVFMAGADNDQGQLGLSLRVNDINALSPFFRKLNLKYRMTVNPIRFGPNDNRGWGIEHAYFMFVPGTNRKVLVKGFVDQSFGEEQPSIFPKRPIVAEIQAGIRVLDGIFLAAEYRHNDFRLGAEDNFAFGIEKNFRW